MDYIKIDGVDSREFSVYAYDNNINKGAKRIYEEYVIPGRNGALKLDTQRYANVSHSYDLICYDRAEQHVFEFRAFLMSLIGYHKIEDTFSNDFYYVACYEDEFDPVFSRNRKLAKFKVEFNRKPQRFLKIGENVITFEDDGTILNPTLYNSKPLFKIYGTGRLYVNDSYIDIVTPSSESDHTYVDCEAMECYYDEKSANQYVGISTSENANDYDYVNLHSGHNQIILGTGITKVEITPRWYMI